MFIGTWKGRRRGSVKIEEGFFPFNHVQLVNKESEEQLKSDETLADLFV